MLLLAGEGGELNEQSGRARGGGGGGARGSDGAEFHERFIVPPEN